MNPNTTTAVPTAAPPDILQGTCDESNPYFWGYFCGSAFLALVIVACRYKLSCSPTFKAGGGCKPDFGRPYSIGILLFHICLWNLAPQAAYFVLFHVFSTSLFDMQTNAACINMASIPFIILFVFAQACLILFAYNPMSMKTDIGGVVTPVEDVGQKKKKVLILGAMGRGALFIDALEKEKLNQTTHETYVVDYSHSTAISFVKYNANCYGVEDQISTRCRLSLWRGRNKFVLPWEDQSFDMVVVSSYIRNALPVGEFMTSDDVKIPRMIRMLREGMRVLKPSGEIFCYDQAANIVNIWADLRDAGYKNTSIVDSGVTAGPIFFMKAKMLKLHCPYVQLVDPASPVDPVGSTNTPLLDDNDDEGAHVDLGAEHPSATADHHKALESKAEMLFAVMVIFQCVVFLILSFASAGLYSPLSLPSNIPLSARVNNLLVSVATSYPMMAYFSRDTQLNSENPPHTVGVLLSRCVISEGIAITASVLLTALLGVPGLLLQILLASDSSLSSDNKALIGIGISIFLGIVMYKRGRAMSQSKWMSKRQIPLEYAKYLQ